MKSFAFLAAAGLASAAAISSRAPATLQAVYFMTNEKTGNRIGAFLVDADGMITNSSSFTSTGGLGARAPSALDGIPGDSLNSQGGLALRGNNLYAVNAGSDTVSALAIDAKDPLKVTLIGKPQSSVGEFPVAAQVSPDGKLMCAASSGTNSGVACYNRYPNGAISAAQVYRKLKLDPVQQNPPVGPINTVSQVLWNLNGSVMYVPVKGGVNGGVGYLAAFDMRVPLKEIKAVESSPAGTVALFGSVPLENDRLFFTDAGFGVGVLQIHPNLTATTVYRNPVKDQQATCWAVYSPYNGYYYATDDNKNTMVAYNVTTGEIAQLQLLKNPNPEMIEIQAHDDKLYALSHGNNFNASVPTLNATIPQHIVVLKAAKDGSVKTIQNRIVMHRNTNVDGLVLLVR